jgi:uncharacterized protein (DUF433 family)
MICTASLESAASHRSLAAGVRQLEVYETLEREGRARIIRTRIPVWLLESLRRGGKTDAELLTAYPTLTAEDLANAWNYARAHQEEMDREIAANGDDA